MFVTELKLLVITGFAMLGFARMIFGCPECKRAQRRVR